MSYALCKDADVMKTLTQLFRNMSTRRPSRPVFQQLELPLGGIRLGREDASVVYELRKIRESLARA